MGFFHIANKPARLTGAGSTSVALLHKAECGACPLNHQAGLKHPHMQPTGSKKPTLYFLGEAVSINEDRSGKHFSGKDGRALRMRLPDEWVSHIRWNNCVRTKPLEGKAPGFVEIECCRPSVVRDIEATKPLAIFGFGNIPLQWATGQSNVIKWCGRRIPVKVGSHTCWFYPMMHPSYIVKTRRYEPRGDGYGSDIEFVFALDMRRALAEVDAVLPTPVVHTREQALADLELIDGSGGWDDVRTIKDALRDFKTEKRVGLDYETKGLRPYEATAKILTVGLSSAKRTLAFALDHSKDKWTDSQRTAVWEAYDDFLHTATCLLVVHNLPFEMEWSAFFFGKEVLRAVPWACTASMAWVLDERMKMGKPDALSLEFLCIQYFGLNVKALNSIDVKDLDTADVLDVLRYNAMDSRYHRLLYAPQLARIKDEELLEPLRHHIARIPTMVLTQMKGVPIDQKVVAKFEKRFNDEIADAEFEIEQLPVVEQFKAQTGRSFKPSNDKDLLYIIRNILKKHVDNVDEKSLETINHPIAAAVLRYRKPAKNLSTYVNPVKTGSPHIFPDGLLHPIMNLTRTVTWRTSSEDPNIQNFPKRKLKEVRGQVRPKTDERVVSFDLGQIQARNVAMESKDAVLVKAFWDRYDIHTDWMERIAKAHPRWITEGVKTLAHDTKLQKAYRNRAKNEMVFPSFFGAQPKSISKYLGIPVEVAEDMHEDFWAMFPDIYGWHKELNSHYHKHGYVTGLSGIHRRAPISPNQLINAPIQADEAIIVCDAMERLSRIDHDRLQANMEIHDDLTFIWNVKEIDELAPIVIREMTKVSFDWINVPILVEMSVGKDWASQEEIGNYSSDTWDRKTVYEKDKAPEWASGNWSDGTGWANSKGMEKS